MTIYKKLCICLLLLSLPLFSQKIQKSAFQIVPLGVKGGIDEKNLSAYLLPLQTQPILFVLMQERYMLKLIER
ncbi:hypothetical protein [Flavobacterium sp. W22_SRS_FP1]|uniref:hypothetical protein n=1 Tax=Flavobacterium sp. W22_SRS_FP1 TaxID=3240276 RepID=UPI003F92BCA1